MGNKVMFKGVRIEKENPSDCYQYKFNEISMSFQTGDFVANTFRTDQSLYFNEQTNEQILDINEQIEQIIKDTVKKVASEKQLAIWTLGLEGWKQKEIKEEVGLKEQSSVSHSNSSLFNKLRKALLNNNEYKQLIKKLKELQDNG
jgi:hypothetical protein